MDASFTFRRLNRNSSQSSWMHNNSISQLYFNLSLLIKIHKKRFFISHMIATTTIKAAHYFFYSVLSCDKHRINYLLVSPQIVLVGCFWICNPSLHGRIFYNNCILVFLCTNNLSQNDFSCHKHSKIGSFQHWNFFGNYFFFILLLEFLPLLNR